MCPGSRPTFVPSGILIHPAVRYNRHGPKIGGSDPILGGGAGSSSNTMSLELRPTFLPSNIGAMPFWELGRGLGPYLTQCGHGRVLSACRVSS